MGWLKKTVKKVGKAVEKGAKSVGKAVEKGAKSAAKTVVNPVKPITNVIKQGAKAAKKIGIKGEVGKAIQKVGKGADKVEKAVQKPLNKVGKAVEKALGARKNDDKKPAAAPATAPASSASKPNPKPTPVTSGGGGGGGGGGGRNPSPASLSSTGPGNVVSAGMGRRGGQTRPTSTLSSQAEKRERDYQAQAKDRMQKLETRVKYEQGRHMYEEGIGRMPATVAGSRGQADSESSVDNRMNQFQQELEEKRRQAQAAYNS